MRPFPWKTHKKFFLAADYAVYLVFFLHDMVLCVLVITILLHSLMLVSRVQLLESAYGFLFCVVVNCSIEYLFWNEIIMKKKAETQYEDELML